MGVDSRRPPLPAPTDLSSVDDHSPVATEVATNVTTRTDKTSYTIPEDGSPIVISTHKKESRIGSHGRNKSQTSLLIEYFEGSKSGDKKGRPSVRVKVTPSSRKSSSNRANDAVQITSIGADRKPSYTRRISLSNSSKHAEVGDRGATELSGSSGSNVSGNPLEIEVLQNGSDLSEHRSSRGIMHPLDSNVSSMPPDSLLEERHGEMHENEDTITKESYLAAPQRTRSRSTSRERIAQKVREKLGQSAVKSRKTVDDYDGREHRRRRSSKSHGDELASAESSVLSSNPVSSQRSYKSNTSQASRVTNNAKLLEKVEDTIKRILLPEITDIKNNQRAERRLRDFDDSRRGSGSRNSLERSISKSSSSPNFRSKPKVVLNKDGDDSGVVLSRGDSEYKKHRKSSGERVSSRKSSGHYRDDGYEEEITRHESSRGGLAKAAAAAVAGGALTAAALKHHDSESDVREHREHRKRRSKSRGSRSRSNSIADTADEHYNRRAEIPPMPMASHINESDITRTSLLSEENDELEHTRTPIREVSRGSLNKTASPASSRTPTRTPVSKGLGMSHGNKSIESPKSIKTRTAALASAAGVGALAGAGIAHHENKHNTASPTQSVSSLRMQYEDPLVPAGLRPRSTASQPSIERLQRSSRGKSNSPSPIAKHSRSRDLTEEFVTPLERRDAAFIREGSQTPMGEDVDEWFDRQHVRNDQYRNSVDTSTNRASYQTNPYPEDEKRFAELGERTHEEQGVKDLGANPEYVHTPMAVESAVASLVEPSTLSSVRPVSYTDSPSKATYNERHRLAEQLGSQDKDTIPMYNGSTISQTMPSNDRWAAIKRHAHSISNSGSTATGSPAQSPVRSMPSHDAIPIKMGISGLPSANDPMPEIGVYDDTKSEVSTNPSIIKGPLGGDVTGKDTWPYTPSPRPAEKELGADAGYGEDAMLGAALAGGIGGAALAHHVGKQATVEDEIEHEDAKDYATYQKEPVDRNLTPTQQSPAALRDEGYVTDAGARTPRAEQQNRNSAAAYAEDPFTSHGQHARTLSGNSHGIDSPLYDSATGKGMEHIQSRDVVALMDHLTVRDAQRSARDTEILTTLVRLGSEMRNNFEDMKRFVYEQDQKIMANTDRGNDQVVQKVLGGPRPQPASSPRTPRRSEEDIQTKRKGVLRRALKGLTGGRSSSDLARIEDMLMQVLDNVEHLRHQGVPTKQMDNLLDDGMDSYEKLRAVPDPGYEPEGMAGTNSTPSQSGHFTVPIRDQKQVFHSGYNGRPGSENRVSTVMEGSEDGDLEPHERNVLDNQFENNERLLTPTQDFRPNATTSPTGLGSPTLAQRGVEMTPRTAEKQQKHKSTNSSIYHPKQSRWSKTTTSSAVPESPGVFNKARPISAASRSGSDLREYDDDEYSLQDDDRLRSTQSLAREQKRETRSIRSQASKITRTPSPLIPSEASYQDEYDERAVSPEQHDDYDPNIDEAKYHAIRNSLLLQHPQPRQGSTSRHQTQLESKAHSYNDERDSNVSSQASGSDFDPAQWGSNGAAALNKNRFSQAEPMSPVSMSTPRANKSKDNAPLVPITQQQVHPTQVEYDDYDDDDDLTSEEDLYDDEPQYSNSGFQRGGRPWYSSPLGSGHLLEPIQEVRYSLETDSGHISPEPQIASARAVTARKITGPRPMGSRNTSASLSHAEPSPEKLEPSGTVRRKPVARSQASRDTLSSQESETF